MDEQNVGIVFGPTLIRQHPDKETASSVFEHQQKLSSIIVCLLQYYNDLFLDTKYKSLTGCK